MRASAAAANVIGQEQPCRVKLRLWRYSPYDGAPARPAAAAAPAPAAAPKGVPFDAAAATSAAQRGAPAAVENLVRRPAEGTSSADSAAAAEPPLPGMAEFLLQAVRVRAAANDSGTFAFRHSRLYCMPAPGCQARLSGGPCIPASCIFAGKASIDLLGIGSTLIMRRPLAALSCIVMLSRGSVDPSVVHGHAMWRRRPQS